MAVPAPDGDRGVYGISVAAELVGMGAQNLRLYESGGCWNRPAPTGAPAGTARTTWTGCGGSATSSTLA